LKDRDSNRKSLGNWGEDFAEKYFEDRGWTIEHRNYTTPFGECDLIISDNDLTVLVEVKTRQSRQFGPPESAVTRDKRDHLRRIARHYRSDKDDSSQLRFDVLAIEFDPDNPTVRHLEGAFEGT
jgi:putative endonuclease